MHIDFHDTACFSLIWDGVKVGNPGKEFNIACVSDCLQGRHAVLPPQAGFFVFLVLVFSSGCWFVQLSSFARLLRTHCQSTVV